MKTRFYVKGMTCASCERRIETAVRKLDGVSNIKADYASQAVEADFDDSKTGIEEIKKAITKAGYEFQDKRDGWGYRLLAVAVIAAALLLLTGALGLPEFFTNIPLIADGMPLSAVFIVGLLTSIHCIGMCGGIGLGVSSGVGAKFDRPLLYNLGRVLSYTAVGAAVGALGSVISFTPLMRGIVMILASLFMLILGLGMLGVPFFRKIRGFKLFSKLANARGAFAVGILNGFMPCGPLQAMQLYALSTASAVRGALAMFVFALGTAPLMLGLGSVSALLSRKFAAKMSYCMAAIVVIMGVFMLRSGSALTGVPVQLQSSPVAENNKTELEGGADRENKQPKLSAGQHVLIEDGKQLISSGMSANSYEAITVQAGIPVKWTLSAPMNAINGCNNAISIPSLNITKELRPGANTIEFTPEKPGVIPFSCWMGMIKSKIVVIPQADNAGSSSGDINEGGAAASDSADDIVTAGYTGNGDQTKTMESGGCCEGSGITADKAVLAGQTQAAAVSAENYGFNPCVLLAQKNVRLDITFAVSGLMPGEMKIESKAFGKIDLEKQTALSLTPLDDIEIHYELGGDCLRIIAVDDLDSVDIEKSLSGLECSRQQ